MAELDPAGQVPPVSGPEPPPVPPVDRGDKPTPPPASEPTPNQEAANYRKQLRAAEARLAQLEADAKARQEADLSDLDKARKRAAELETTLTGAEARARAAILRAEGLVLGGKLGVPADRLGLLVKLLQVDGGDVEFDADGTPARESLERVIKSILKDNPILLAVPAPEAPAPVAPGLPTNPARTVASTYTNAQIEAMTPEEVMKQLDQIVGARSNGR